MRARPANFGSLASLGLLVACLVASTAFAEEPAESKVSGGPYTLQPIRIAGGGGSAAGATFSINGTVGQHDAAVVSVQGGPYEVEGGLQPATGTPNAPTNVIFANSFE